MCTCVNGSPMSVCVCVCELGVCQFEYIGKAQDCIHVNCV